jgi:hypothetical protein
MILNVFDALLGTSDISLNESAHFLLKTILAEVGYRGSSFPSYLVGSPAKLVGSLVDIKLKRTYTQFAVSSLLDQTTCLYMCYNRTTNCSEQFILSEVGYDTNWRDGMHY